MNRRERKRYAAELRMLARSGLQASEIPRLKEWTCDCTGCGLLRAGVCTSCSWLIHAQILERGKPGVTIHTSVCSGACREGVERYFEGCVA